MNEVDDRLAGDPVWELFPYPASSPAQDSSPFRKYHRWLAVAGLLAVCWLLSPALALVIGSLAVAVPDVHKAGLLARAIPDKAGGKVCARFTYAWAAWKCGMTAFVLMFLTLFGFLLTKEVGREPTPPFEMLIVGPLWMAGFIISAGFTASGLLAAYCSGMRVWIGEGVNQARTLLLGMLIVGFVFVVLGPLMIWLCNVAVSGARGYMDSWQGLAFAFGMIGCMFVGPVAILLVLDWVSRHVVADQPGKFGPKVPTVGKWESGKFPS